MGLVAILLSGAGLFGAPPGDAELLRQLLRETGYFKKLEGCRELGRLRTANGREFLLKLLDGSDSWDREAAVSGLVFFKEDAVRVRLVAAAVTDNRLCDIVRPFVATDGEAYTPLLIGALAEHPVPDDRARLYGLLGSAKTAAAATALSNMATDVGAPGRTVALKELVSGHPQYLDLARSLMKDREVGATAAGLVLAKGNPTDWGYFREVATNASGDGSLRFIGFQAAAKWAPKGECVALGRTALEGKDESLRQAVLLAIRPDIVPKPAGPALTRGPPVVEPLHGLFSNWMNLVSTAGAQRTRHLAAENLLMTGNPESVPAVIPLLKEPYLPESAPVGISIVSSLLTLGISGAFDSLNAAFSRSEYERRRKELVAGLNRITGAGLTDDGEVWREWALTHGYAVDGETLAGMLFSAVRARRDRAVKAAWARLPPGDQAALVARFGGNWDNPDLEMRGELAKAIFKKGGIGIEP